MSSHRFRRNYSQNDLGQLINESQKKAEYINRMIDNDIHFNMMTESYSPLKEKIQYLRSNYNINNKNYIPPDSQNSQRNIINNFNNKNTSRFYPNKNLNISANYNNNYYNNNNRANNNNNLYNSLEINKPFHRERKHFPSIFNKGNFFQNENFHLIKRKKINNKPNFENANNQIINNAYNNRYNNFNGEEEFKSYNNQNKNNFRNMNLRRSDSMINMTNNLPKLNAQNKLIDDNRKYSENYSQNKEQYLNSGNEKHYSPRRYDYEGSRYGDNTYNFYLNEPMRGDKSSEWKFPPLYCYNSKIDYGKSFPNY